MAVTSDTSGVMFNDASTFGACSAGSTSGNPFTCTYTPIGVPTAFVLTIYQNQGVGDFVISSVKYGGVTMAAGPGGVLQIPATPTVMWIFGLASPPSGAQTVSLTWTGPTVPNGASQCRVQCFSFLGSSTSTCFRSGSSNQITDSSGALTSLSNSITAVAGDMGVDVVAVKDFQASPFSPGANQGNISNFGNIANGSTEFCSSSTTAFTWSWNTGSNYADMAVAVQQAAFGIPTFGPLGLAACEW